MDKAQYLNNNWQILAALQWLYYEREGLGILLVKDDLIRFKPYKELSEKVRRLCRENLPERHVIVRFYDGNTMGFEPPMTPQQCFEIMKPQFNDFFLRVPEGLEV